MESERLKSEIKSRQELLERIDSETRTVEEVSTKNFLTKKAERTSPPLTFSNLCHKVETVA